MFCDVHLLINVSLAKRPSKRESESFPLTGSR